MAEAREIKGEGEGEREGGEALVVVAAAYDA